MPATLKRPEQGAARSRAEYCVSCGDHELKIFSPRSDPHQIAAVSEGAAEFALVVEEPAIVLCARFGDGSKWLSALYEGDDSRHDPDSIPPLAGACLEARALLHVSLVDAVTGRIQAERNVTLWLDFSRALNEAIRDRARTLFHPIDHERALARLRRRYPSDDILAASAAVRCFGSL